MHHMPKYASQTRLIKEEFYTDKKKQYKEKYNPILNRESTDSKITDIVQNL